MIYIDAIHVHWREEENSLPSQNNLVRLFWREKLRWTPRQKWLKSEESRNARVPALGPFEAKTHGLRLKGSGGNRVVQSPAEGYGSIQHKRLHERCTEEAF